jgi:hypothetical protein
MQFVDQASGYNGGTIVYTYSTNSIQITQSANSSVSAESLDYGNGWIRLIMKFTTNVAQNYNYQAIESIGGDSFIWGAQLEQQSYATSYIPTDGASATRNQELCNNATPVINSEEGVLYAEISALANDGVNRIISLSNGSQSNRVIIFYTSVNNQIRVISSTNSSNQFDRHFTLPDVKSIHKVAIKYKANDFSFWVDGSKISSEASGLAPIGLSELSFDNGSGGANFFGNTKGLKYYPKALADVQLEALTSFGSFTEMANALNYTII